MKSQSKELLMSGHVVFKSKSSEIYRWYKGAVFGKVWRWSIVLAARFIIWYESFAQLLLWRTLEEVCRMWLLCQHHYTALSWKPLIYSLCTCVRVCFTFSHNLTNPASVTVLSWLRGPSYPVKCVRCLWEFVDHRAETKRQMKETEVERWCQMVTVV